MRISKLINLTSKILLVLILVFIPYFIFIKNTLINPDTVDIQVISGLILMFIFSNILKHIIQSKS